MCVTSSIKMAGRKKQYSAEEVAEICADSGSENDLFGDGEDDSPDKDPCDLDAMPLAENESSGEHGEAACST
jgi:hypothetical protein